MRFLQGNYLYIAIFIMLVIFIALIVWFFFIFSTPTIVKADFVTFVTTNLNNNFVLVTPFDTLILTYQGVDKSIPAVNSGSFSITENPLSLTFNTGNNSNNSIADFVLEGVYSLYLQTDPKNVYNFITTSVTPPDPSTNPTTGILFFNTIL